MNDHKGPATNAKGVLEKVLDKIAELIRSLPVPQRAIVLIFVVAAGIICLYMYNTRSSTSPSPPTVPSITVAPPIVVNPSLTANPTFTNVINLQTGSTPATGAAAPALPGAPPSISSSDQPVQYVGGRSDPSHPGAQNDIPQNLEAAHKAAEDEAAVKWHFTNLAVDNPPEIPIVADTDANNYLRYRYFGKSDKCVFIDRRENGVDTEQWARDPTYHKHDIEAPNTSGVQHPRSAQAGSEAGKLIFGLLDKLTPTALASTESSDQRLAAPEQGGGPEYCVNPHPGNFRYWWGPPIDQCNSPMYRQFDDGCTHYQVYNRCANAWDVRIFWTYCHPPPHN
jgi:hypothetical protein